MSSAIANYYKKTILKIKENQNKIINIVLIIKLIFDFLVLPSLFSIPFPAGEFKAFANYTNVNQMFYILIGVNSYFTIFHVVVENILEVMRKILKINSKNKTRKIKEKLTFRPISLSFDEMIDLNVYRNDVLLI